MTEQYFYHPDYDGHVHVDYANLNSIGTSFFGNMGLLSRLELKAGLIHAEFPNDDCEREEQYKVAIRKSSLKCLAASFAMDEVNVTRQILRWRDALRMADWNFNPNPSYSDVLNDIAEIESNFNSSIVGISDRWIAIKRYLDGGKSLLINITANCDRSQIHPTIAYILDKLGAKYEPLSDENGGNVNGENEEKTSGGKSGIEIYKFKNAFDAYRAAALTLDPTKDVVVSQNSAAFNDVLKSVGHSSIEATIDDSNSSVLQLFKLRLLMFADPKNLRNVVSYLKTSPCPVLCGDRLGDYLLNHCGWGDSTEWNDFVNNVPTWNKWDSKTQKSVPYTSTEIKDIQNDFKGFKSFLHVVNPSAVSGVAIKQSIDDLINWTKNSRAGQTVSRQKANLRNLCRRLNLLINVNKTYNADDITTLVDNANTSSAMDVDSFKVDSFFVYPSLGCIHDSVSDGKIVWVDCYGELVADYDYSFLSPDDVKNLTALGVSVWSKVDQMAAKNSLLLSSAKHAGKEVLLFVPQNADGLRVAASPLISMLGADMDKALTYSLTLSSNPVVSFASKAGTPYYNLNPNTTIPQRQHESFSSLALLIDSPFDYVLKYVCGLYAPSIDSLDGLNRICGTVAHRTLETICNTTGFNVSNVQQIITNQTVLDGYIEQAALENGILLLRPENSFLLTTFKNEVGKSFCNLLDIISQNNLSIVGCEVDYLESPSPIVGGNELTAQCDLVLEDAHSNKYIFDLKYGSPTYYRSKLIDDSALQLDIYKYCVMNDVNRKSNVEMVGYFNLKLGCLFTTYGGLLHSNNVEVIKPKKVKSNVMNMVRDSYNFRFDEFNSKHLLEEGETCDVTGLTYHTTPDLYPLGTNLGKKSVNRFSHFGLFKGECK
ncbi:MAG: PD-(D/E)XK nuclease family protein [Paludibacteraceae bacterium]|nr:PD-(D/E)XK nuclease family protein [Paludibacteraceae bacterium]